MKRTLDCESKDSTYRSLEVILGVSCMEIKAALSAFDIDDFLNKNPRHPEAPEDVIYGVVKRISKSTTFDQTCWFHLTRTADPESFKRGILPLDAALDQIWAQLETLVRPKLTEDDLTRFLTRSVEGHYGHLYAMKTRAKYLCGPYAMLVREIAFHARQIGNHDYLAVPEIVDDICRGLAEWNTFDLLTAYRESTRPCIVKFLSEGVSEHYLCAAINYLYASERAARYNIDCNTCFDGAGEAVPPEQILKVELL